METQNNSDQELGGLPEYVAVDNPETGKPELWKLNLEVPNEDTPVGKLPLTITGGLDVSEQE